VCRAQQIPGSLNVDGEKGFIRHTPLPDLPCQMIDNIHILNAPWERGLIGNVAINHGYVFESCHIFSPAPVSCQAPAVKTLSSKCLQEMLPNKTRPPGDKDQRLSGF
jgi:hypothetical protein